MAASFFFYDLETSGFDPRSARVMQFGGQRTDLALNPISDPVNVLIKITPDVIPSPDAILVTGITPQQTLTDGITEAEFLRLFYKEIYKPGTIFTGFNSIRFDDEFMRFLHYRNYYDAYEWQWMDNCSRWDLLDVVRMTRALRPEGIEWSFAPDGKPANRLEYLAKVNKLDHEQAHDALSDVRATIAVARLVRDKQPDLFNFLLDMRDKKKVAKLVTSGQPFVYTSGRYPSAELHTTVAMLLADHPQAGSGLVYDLRHDPLPYIDMTPEEIVAAWRYSKDPDRVRLPVKTVKYNRAPAVAPIGVIKDEATQKRLGLTLDIVATNRNKLIQNQAKFANIVLKAVALLDAERKVSQTSLVDDQLTVDARLYDGFINDTDRSVMRAVRSAGPQQLTQIADDFDDDRLKSLMPLYKARNFSTSLTDEERAAWEAYCQQQLMAGGNASRLAQYFARLEELTRTAKTDNQRYLLEELQLYGQSIIPADAVG